MCGYSYAYHMMCSSSVDTSDMGIIQQVKPIYSLKSVPIKNPNPFPPHFHPTSFGTSSLSFPSKLPPPGVQSDPEGALWRDPPNYWEQIVYPAYVRAHAHMLSDEDIENGKPNGKVEDLVLVDAVDVGMDVVFEKACEAMVVKV